jgi:ribulose-phosphate 3-epimerase
MVMVSICPTVTAHDETEFKVQMERLAPFVERVHVDLADGVLAPVKLASIKDVWWPIGVKADLHLMYQNPLDVLELAIDLHPQLLIVHAEADGNFLDIAKRLHGAHIKVGLAILPKTPVESIVLALNQVDHVLIFSGNLGHFGGTANLRLLARAALLKKLKPSLEIGWDGGINDTNAARLFAGGVDVLNTGGFIQKASDPKAAYATLVKSLKTPKLQ